MPPIATKALWRWDWSQWAKAAIEGRCIAVTMRAFSKLLLCWPKHNFVSVEIFQLAGCECHHRRRDRYISVELAVSRPQRGANAARQLGCDRHPATISAGIVPH
jgi:hypothetical protein